MLTISKRYDNFPFAHRQHTHAGHCHFMHGHNWSFVFVFAARELDANGFVIDFGSLGWLRDWLTEHFNHTLCLSADDPAVEIFSTLADKLSVLRCLDMGDKSQLHPGQNIGADRLDIASVVKLCILPAVSAEGIAKYVFRSVSARLFSDIPRVSLVSVTVEEDNKNSATFVAR